MKNPGPPDYLTGGAAANKLAGMYGIAPQDYGAAFSGSSGNKLTNPTGQSDQWSGYLAANQDVMDYWKSNAKLREMYPNANDFAAYHYSNFGQQEGRQLPTAGGQDQTTQPVGGAQQMQTAYDPMADFTGSMENRLATEMSDVGFGKIKSQLGAAGKAISGAGEKRYANEFIKNRYGAFGDYKNGLQSLAGMNQTATNALNSAGNTYASNAGNSMMAAGQAKGNALAGAYKGIGDGVAGAIGAVNDYGKKQWGWG